MEDEQRQALEELRIIRQMMQRTARRWTGEGWAVWVIWGVGGILASGLSEALTAMRNKEGIVVVWNAYWIVCLILTLYFTRGEWRSAARKPMTFIGKTIGMTWCAIGAAFLLTALAAAVTKSPEMLAATFVVLAGVGVFISGALVEEPVLYGAGMLWWCGAIAVLIVPDHVYLVEAALLLFGYLLPAYIIRNRASRGGSENAQALGTPA